MAQLPYNPTAVLTSAVARDLVYILQSEIGSSQGQLKAINISSSLTLSELHPIDITKSLPFDTSAGSAVTAFAGDQGEIFAVVGKCTDKIQGASVWTFRPRNDGTDGEWTEAAVALQEGASITGAQGSLYLGGGASFSSIVNGTESLYFFGGMCPSSTDQSVATWQSSAAYSDTLLYLQSSNDEISSSYMAESVATRGPPVAEAGFTITPLSPTYFNSTTGNETMEQNIVLIGGHTQTAFINMSQVAILSLPEQTWSFVPISEPNPNSVEPRSGHTAVFSEDGQSIVVMGGWVGDVNTPADPQLAVLQIGEGYGGIGQWQWTVPTASGSGPGANGIYGHGATMLPGNVVLVTGGYTIGSGSGELARRSTANPQSYLYNVSSNSWMPSYTNPGPSASEESGAANGNGPSSATKTGLGAGLGVGLALLLLAVGLFFFWRRHRRREQRAIREEDLRGLSIGANRVQSPMFGFGGIDGRGGAPEAGGYVDYPQTRGADVYPWAPSLTEPAIPGQLRRNEAERTGVLVEVPSPTRGLRRSLHSRGHHWYEDGRRSRGSSHIHPIDEREEYEPVEQPYGQQLAESGQPAERAAGTEETNSTEMAQIGPVPFLARPPSDPFIDPPEQRSLLDGSRSPSPQSPLREHDVEILGATAGAIESTQHGPSDQAAASGRLSPNKSDRTSSTLSDASSRSMVSALSQPYSVGGAFSVSRTISQRSAALFSSRPLSSSGLASGSPPSTTMSPPVRTSPVGDTTGNTREHSDMDTSAGAPSHFALPLISPLHRIRRKPVTMPQGRPSSGVVELSDYKNQNTASPTFKDLQAEGPALLYGSPAPAAHQSTYNSSQSPPAAETLLATSTEEDSDNFDAEPFSRPKPPRPRSWMGSMRRVLTGSSSNGNGNASSWRTSSVLHRSGTPSPTNRIPSPTKEGPRFPLTGSGPRGELEHVYMAANTESMNVYDQQHNPPQRSLSTSGASLWAGRTQQGARDWDVEPHARYHRGHSAAHSAAPWGDNSSGGGSGNSRGGSAGGGSAGGGSGGSGNAGAQRQSGASLMEYSAPEWSSSGSDGASMAHSHLGDHDEEWDVESAVERRVVQLMFTVPRERLRVVNAVDGEAEAASLSAASVKSAGSFKSAASVKSIRKVVEVDGGGGGSDGGGEDGDVDAEGRVAAGGAELRSRTKEQRQS